jgi:hypothetical protein
MSRWYCGTALGGTTPDWSTTDGTTEAALSIVTMSPESMVSTGFTGGEKVADVHVFGAGHERVLAARGATAGDARGVTEQQASRRRGA